MSAPRFIVPGRYYLVSRRCTQRQFLLRPDRKTNGAFLYCFAEAAARYGIEVVAVCAMSNHYHAVIYDPQGNVSAFLAHFHKMVAKVMNARWGRWENLWATEPSSMVDCIGAGTVFDETIYALGNPAKDQLVEKVFDWPGASSLVAQLHDKTLMVTRPDWFFDAEGAMPETVELRFHRPRGFEGLSHEQWAEKIRTAVAEVESRAATARRARGSRVVGRKAVLRQSPLAAPRSSEPRRNLRPEVASRSTQHRVEALKQRKSFRERYRAARLKLSEGVRDVVFPAGTYLLRVRHLVRCEPFLAPT